MPTTPTSPSSSWQPARRTRRAARKKITAFLVDKGTKGFTVRDGYSNVSHRGYNNCILEFNDCRLHKSQILGEVAQGLRGRQ